MIFNLAQYRANQFVSHLDQVEVSALLIVPMFQEAVKQNLFLLRDVVTTTMDVMTVFSLITLLELHVRRELVLHKEYLTVLHVSQGTYCNDLNVSKIMEAAVHQ